MSKKLKKKTTALAVLGVLGLLLAGPTSAAAFGFGPGKGVSRGTPEAVAKRQTEIFAKQAVLTGATLDEVRKAWTDGISFKDFALSKGLSEDQLKEKLQAEKQARLKARLQTLVDKNAITQAQADKRYEKMKDHRKPKAR